MRPVMNFHVGEALDFGEQLTNGPVIFFWGQSEFMPPPPHIEDMWPKEPPPLTWWMRRRGVRLWKVVMRLQPPESEDLSEWGGRVAAAAGTEWNPRRGPDGATAIFLPAAARGRDPGEAIAGATQILQRLQGFEVVGLQVQVEAWEQS